MRIGKHAIAVISLIVTLTLVMPMIASAAYVGDVEISSQGAAVIDYDTGLLIFGYNEAVQRVPASMLKMVAIHVVYDAIKSGKTTLDTMLPISPSTSEFSYNRIYSNVPLSRNSTYSVQELIEVVIIRSACAATVALGEGIFGSEKAFVELMNMKAGSLNIRASFADSWGGSKDNRVSPLAFAWLMRALITEHPEVLEISAMPTVNFRGESLANSNLRLGVYPGLDGLKTGYTDPAGYCFTGTAQRNGRRIISVTMGSTMSKRYPDTDALLDYGFANVDKVVGDHYKDLRAAPSSASLIMNGEGSPLSAYVINDYHYFKLRDIAYLLNGTQRQLEVMWNASDNSIALTSGLPYTAQGSELQLATEGPRPYRPTPSSIHLDGKTYAFESYLIDGFNYFKLRDLADLIGFEVSWTGETRTVTINTPTDPGEEKSVYDWQGEPPIIDEAA